MFGKTSKGNLPNWPDLRGPRDLGNPLILTISYIHMYVVTVNRFNIFIYLASFYKNTGDVMI